MRITALLFFDSSAFPAIAPSFFGEVGICWRVLVPRWAMSFGTLASAVGVAANGKSGKVSEIFGADNLIIRKSTGSSVNYSVNLQSVYFGQGGSRVDGSIDKNSARNALVSLLLLFRRPIAIVRLVISVVVSALDARSGRTLAHVGDKLSETVPFAANRNASTTIVLPLLEGGVTATTAHALPDDIKRMGIFKWHDNPPIRQFHVMQEEG